MADAETSEADVAKNRQLIEASREGDLTTVLQLINAGIEHSSPILSYSALSILFRFPLTSPLLFPTFLHKPPPLRLPSRLPPSLPSHPPPTSPFPLPPAPFLPYAPFYPLIFPPPSMPSFFVIPLPALSSHTSLPPPTQNPSSQTPREGADVAYADVDAQGKTALMAAAEGGRADVVRALLGEGAVWNAVDMGGKSAGDYAMEGVVAWGEGAEGEEEKNEEERTRRQEVLDTLIDAGKSLVAHWRLGRGEGGGGVGAAGGGGGRCGMRWIWGGRAQGTMQWKGWWRVGKGAEEEEEKNEAKAR
ncbi:unnamed protein product [Closterium sp. NIES-65]|nr:unnamed protein product [Closterium sp. NIES-65]